jgi:hypothetical protein
VHQRLQKNEPKAHISGPSRLHPCSRYRPGAGWAYVRLADEKVDSTANLQGGRRGGEYRPGCRGRIIGLEITGVQKFDLKALIELAGLEVVQKTIDRAIYTRSDTPPLVESVLK